jgi:hypothetical protein
MGGQRRPQVIVHRRVIEGHRQHVEHRSDLAADNFDAGLGENGREKSPIAWIGGPFGTIVGLDLPDLGRLVAVNAGDLALAGVGRSLGETRATIAPVGTEQPAKSSEKPGVGQKKRCRIRCSRRRARDHCTIRRTAKLATERS